MASMFDLPLDTPEPVEYVVEGRKYQTSRTSKYLPHIGERVVVFPPGLGYRGTGTVLEMTTQNPGTPTHPVYFIEYDQGGGTWIGSLSLYPEGQEW